MVATLVPWMLWSNRLLVRLASSVAEREVGLGQLVLFHPRRPQAALTSLEPRPNDLDTNDICRRRNPRRRSARTPRLVVRCSTGQSVALRLGIAHHFGWAVAVTASASRGRRP
jgi:hypothetical protein